MNWFNVQLCEDGEIRINGHLRAKTAKDAVKVVLGRGAHWSFVDESDRKAKAIDSRRPGSWCRAVWVERPVPKQAPKDVVPKKRSVRKDVHKNGTAKRQPKSTNRPSIKEKVSTVPTASRRTKEDSPNAKKPNAGRPRRPSSSNVKTTAGGAPRAAAAKTDIRTSETRKPADKAKSSAPQGKSTPRTKAKAKASQTASKAGSKKAVSPTKPTAAPKPGAKKKPAAKRRRI